MSEETLFPESLFVTPQIARALLGADNVIFVDTRPAAAYAQARIPGAISIPAREIASRYREVIIHDVIVIYGSGDEESDLTSCIVDVFRRRFGIDEIVGLEGGFARWESEGLPVDRSFAPAPAPSAYDVSLPWEEIDVIEAYCRLQKGYTLVDIREPQEIYQLGYPQGAILMPMGDAPARLEYLARKTPLLLICNSGNRSGILAEFLVQQGFSPNQVANVLGGIIAWQIHRLPWQRPPIHLSSLPTVEETETHENHSS